MDRIKNYLKERNIPIDSLEANGILEGYELAMGESFDYWAHLEHQAAIAVMQGMCANPQDCNMSWDWMAECAAKGAHTLVEKLKEREE